MALINHNTEFRGHLGQQKDVIINDVMIIDDVPHKIHRIVAHEFSIFEDDPDLYAGVPLLEWQNSEVGQWVMQHSVQTPTFHRYLNYVAYNYRYVILAWLKGVDNTFFQLKWGQKV